VKPPHVHALARRIDRDATTVERGLHTRTAVDLQSTARVLDLERRACRLDDTHARVAQRARIVDAHPVETPRDETQEQSSKHHAATLVQACVAAPVPEVMAHARADPRRQAWAVLPTGT